MVGFELGENGQPIRITRTNLNPSAKMWSVFSISNLKPNIHTFDANLDRAYLIYGIVIGM